MGRKFSSIEYIFLFGGKFSGILLIREHVAHNEIENYFFVRLRLCGAIYRPDSFVFMLRYCANLKAIRYESTSLNRIVADKSHRVIAA